MRLSFEVRHTALFLTAMLLGALFIEVHMYHEAAVFTNQDPYGLWPLIATPVVLFLVLTFASWPQSWSLVLHLVGMIAMIATGIAGTAIHLAIHANSWRDVLTARLWLGDPPTLAPLSFTVAGLLGLLAVTGVQASELRRQYQRLAAVTRMCYGLAAVAAAATAVLITGFTTATYTVTLPLVIMSMLMAAFGFAFEAAALVQRRARPQGSSYPGP